MGESVNIIEDIHNHPDTGNKSMPSGFAPEDLHTINGTGDKNMVKRVKEFYPLQTKLTVYKVYDVYSKEYIRYDETKIYGE